MRFLLSAFASLAVLVPGMVMGLQIGQWLAPMACPPPNGPNLCALLATVVLMGVVPLALSAAAGAIVWKVTGHSGGH